jgi:ankyrin repeat protein/serine/threonine protein kinase
LRTVQQLKLSQCPYEQLREVAPVGEGSTFIVGKCEYEGRIVAVKHIKVAVDHGEHSEKTLRSRLQAVLREISIMHHGPLAKHPNILGLIGYGWRMEAQRPFPYIVVEFAPLGCMRPFLEGRSLSLRDKLIFAGDIASGLMALHQVGIVHGDLKLENIIVFEDWNRPSGSIAKLCDFGHSIFLGSENQSQQYWGTTLYLPPEALFQKSRPIPLELLHKCDIWAYGLALWEILADGRLYFQESWCLNSTFLRSTALEESFQSAYVETSLPDTGSLEASGLDAERNLLYQFKRFDLKHLSDLAQSFVANICPVSDWRRNFLKPLMKLTLNPEPSKRLSDLTRSPIISDWSKTASASALQAKLALHTRKSEFGYDMFRPDQQSFILWEHQVQILQALEAVATEDKPGTYLASAYFELVICYAIGFGCNRDNSKANQYLRKALELDFMPAELFGDSLTSVFSPLPWAHDRSFASNLAAGFATQRNIDKNSGLLLCKGRSPDAFKGRVDLQLTASHHINAISKTAQDISGPGNSSTLLKETYLCYRAQSSPVSWLEFSILTGNDDYLEDHLPEFGSLNELGAWGETPLIIACRRGNAKLVQTLLDAGADPSLATTDGCSLLHWLFCLGSDAATIADSLLKDYDLSDLVNKPCSASFTLNPQWPTELSGTPLAFAVTAGHRELVQCLLSYGAIPDGRAFNENDTSKPSSFTAIHLAVKYHFHDILHDLLVSAEAGYQKRKKTWTTRVKGFLLRPPPPPPPPPPPVPPDLGIALNFMTPFERYGVHGRDYKSMLTKTIGILSKQSIEAKSSTGLTPLFQAIDYNDHDLVSALLDVFPELATEPLLQPDAPNTYTFPLHFAIEVSARRNCEDSLIIPQRIANSSTLLLKDNKDRTVLHMAATTDSDRLTRWLVSKGVEIDARNHVGSSPLLMSRSACNTMALLQSGAKKALTDWGGLNAIHYACRRGALSQLITLLEAGVDCNLNDKSSSTPLHYSVCSRSKPCVEKLISKKANMNARNRHGDTPLHLAVNLGLPELVNLLIQNGADLKFKNGKGLTPVMVATLSNSTEVFDLVLNNEFRMLASRPNFSDILRSMLHRCAAGGSGKMMQHLLTHERIFGHLDANSDENGESPLHSAAKTGNVETARVLIANGAILDAADFQGVTPLLRACYSKTPSRVAFCNEILEMAGPEILLGHTSDEKDRTPWTVAKDDDDFPMMTFLLLNTPPEQVELMISLHPVTLHTVQNALRLDFVDFIYACSSIEPTPRSMRFFATNEASIKLGDRIMFGASFVKSQLLHCARKYDKQALRSILDSSSNGQLCGWVGKEWNGVAKRIGYQYANDFTSFTNFKAP